MPRHVRDDGTSIQHHDRFSALCGERRRMVCNMSEEEQKNGQP